MWNSPNRLSEATAGLGCWPASGLTVVWTSYRTKASGVSLEQNRGERQWKTVKGQ